MHWRSVPKGTATPHARGSATARRRSPGAGRSSPRSPLITWHRHTGASFTSDLTPSQHAAAGAARKLVALALRKSAHAVSPDRGVLHSAGCGEGGAGAAADPPQGGRKLGRGRPGMQGIGGSGSRRAGGSGTAGAPESLHGGRNRGRGRPGMQGIGGSGTLRAGGSGGSGGSGAPAEPSQGGRNRGRGRPGMQGIGGSGIRGRQKDGGCGATSSACSWTLAADEGPRLAATAAKTRRMAAIVHLDGAMAWMPVPKDCCFVV